MDDYETFTEANLLWDPVAMKWARPSSQPDSLSHLMRGAMNSHVMPEDDVDNDLINTLQSAGVDLSGLFKYDTNDQDVTDPNDRNVINDYAYSAALSSINGLSNGHQRSQFSANNYNDHFNQGQIQSTFKYTIPGKRKVKRNLDTVCMIYYLVLAVTIMCVAQFLVLPIVYEDSPVTLRYRTWFSWYVFYHILINYVLVYIYSAPYEQSSRNFADPGLPHCGWNRCDECEQLKPPRTHHCPFCDKCVLKRDHHCFFTGSCIGFHNQRHFIVMCFYCAVGGIYAFYIFWQYFCLEYYFPLSPDFWHFILPATIVEWIVGRSSFLFVFLVLLFYLAVTTAAGATFMFLWQMYLVCCGITTHEFAKGVKTYRGAPLHEKLHSVFGRWFWVPFIIPLPLTSIKGDGMHWTHVEKRI